MIEELKAGMKIRLKATGRCYYVVSKSSINHSPIYVNDNEINLIDIETGSKMMCYEGFIKKQFEEVKEQLHKDDKIKIIDGVFKGIEGTIDTILSNSDKLYIFVDDSNESLITVDIEDVELIKSVVPEKAKFEELKEASKLLIDFLNKYYDPMTSAIVTEGRVDIVRNEMGMPLEIRD